MHQLFVVSGVKSKKTEYLDHRDTQTNLSILLDQESVIPFNLPLTQRLLGSNVICLFCNDLEIFTIL